MKTRCNVLSQHLRCQLGGNTLRGQNLGGTVHAWNWYCLSPVTKCKYSRNFHFLSRQPSAHSAWSRFGFL